MMLFFPGGFAGGARRLRVFVDVTDFDVDVAGGRLRARRSG